SQRHLLKRLLENTTLSHRQRPFPANSSSPFSQGRLYRVGRNHERSNSLRRVVPTMSEEETLSGRGRSQQLGRMGEYAGMAQFVAKSWVSNVYSPAADTG